MRVTSYFNKKFSLYRVKSCHSFQNTKKKKKKNALFEEVSFLLLFAKEGKKKDTSPFFHLFY